MIKTPLRLLLLLVSLLAVSAAGQVAVAQQVSVSSAPSPLGYTYPYDDGELEAMLGEAPVVLELFSSQACMFCPMADHFVSDLKQRTNVIILACHVDYFDVRDGAISTSACSDQQRSYARSIKGATLYTPQVIINGEEDYVGYEFDRYMDDIVEFSKAAQVQDLAVKHIEEEEGVVSQGRRFELDLVPFTLKDGKDAKDLDIWMYMVEKGKTITVSEGANKGKELPYVNIVRKSQKIGRWDGSPQKLGFTAELRDEYEGVTVLLKNDRGVILGAKHLAF